MTGSRTNFSPHFDSMTCSSVLVLAVMMATLVSFAAAGDCHAEIRRCEINGTRMLDPDHLNLPCCKLASLLLCVRQKAEPACRRHEADLKHMAIRKAEAFKDAVTENVKMHQKKGIPVIRRLCAEQFVADDAVSIPSECDSVVQTIGSAKEKIHVSPAILVAGVLMCFVVLGLVVAFVLFFLASQKQKRFKSNKRSYSMATD